VVVLIVSENRRIVTHKKRALPLAIASRQNNARFRPQFRRPAYADTDLPSRDQEEKVRTWGAASRGSAVAVG